MTHIHHSIAPPKQKPRHRWFPRPKRWITISWFGGIQIINRPEEP